MLKFDFAVQTRNGQKIDSIVIAGQNQQDAERKLFQMYHHCTVLSCNTRTMPERSAVVQQLHTIEELVDLIGKEDG